MLKIYVDTTANYKPWSGAVSTYETILVLVTWLNVVTVVRSMMKKI